MSRTIRRKNSHNMHWYLDDWVECDSKYGGKYWKILPMQGEEREKKLKWLQSDAGYCRGPSKWFRQNEQQSYRAKARTELIKYYKDETHEVQIRANPRWPYWD